MIRSLRILLAVACAAALAPRMALAAEAVRPNVVLILCDDLGFSDFGCYGSEIQTPNINSLAAGGLRFTQFYNCAVCLTTRAALVTGLHPRQGPDRLLRASMTTIGEVAERAGYQTSLSGKWHLGSAAPSHPNDVGFSEYFGLLGGASNHWDPTARDPEFLGGVARLWAHNREAITKAPEGFYSTDAITDHAVQNIRRFAAAQKPFLVHVCYTAPHVPLHAPAEDIARYRGKYDDGFFKLRERRHQRQLEMGIVDSKWKLSALDKKLGPWPQDYEVPAWEQVRDQARERGRMETYAAMIDHLDQGVGRLLAALKDSGVDRNTLVLILSDNGGCASMPANVDGLLAYNGDRMPGPPGTYDHLGPGWGWAVNTPFRRHKVWNYEGGIATPLVAYWPGVIAPGKLTREVGHVVDILPTLVDVTGGNYPTERGGVPVIPCEGLSLLPVLRGGTRAGHDNLCWALYGNRAIRQGDWKLTWGHTREQWELYDLAADRTETQDLAAAQSERVAAMSALWQAWAQRTEVFAPGSRFLDIPTKIVAQPEASPKPEGKPAK